jgi:Immunity protein Imm6
MFPREKEEKRLAAWGAVCVAIMYVTWRAWKSEGRDGNGLPQTMESVDETWLLELHRYAGRSGISTAR